ncbi:MAG: aldo/keto reductase [Desulfobacterales bacterium]|nr:MAG: aldo/keto reductase [Desulfobacterales bacterium]
MDPFQGRKVGTTNIEVTCLGFGGASLGNMYKAVDEAEAQEAIRAAHAKGIRYFDTAPMYGFGKSERLYGAVLANVPRDRFVLSTKVGRLIIKGAPPPEAEATPFVDINDVHTRFDYSRDGVLRSLEESRKRLQIEKIDIVYIHDPDVDNRYKQALEEAYPTLAALRSQKVIEAVGVGMNQAEMLCDFARNADFDCFLLAGRYTLLDQIALKELLPLCAQKNISIVIGGAYNSGILATGAVEGAHYNYAPAPPAIIAKTQRIEEVCARHGVPLKAAALQFPFGHPSVVANIPGTSHRARFNENLALMTQRIPADFWAELKAEKLLAERTPVPDGSDDG